MVKFQLSFSSYFYTVPTDIAKDIIKHARGKMFNSEENSCSIRIEESS